LKSPEKLSFDIAGRQQLPVNRLEYGVKIVKIRYVNTMTRVDLSVVISIHMPFIEHVIFPLYYRDRRSGTGGCLCGVVDPVAL
jgi:hypothetical protein